MKIPELIERNKYVFGTYSAMALMNIRTVLNHIQKMADIEGVYEDEKENYTYHPITQLLAPDNKLSVNPEKVEFVIEKLYESFPFLVAMTESQRINSNKDSQHKRYETNHKDLYYILKNIFNVLLKYRNYTCHYLLKDDCWTDGSNFLAFNEQKIAYSINDYYTSALRKIRERFNYGVEQLKFIQDYRYKSTVRDGKRTMITDLDFFLSLQSFNNDRTRKLHLSGIGVVLLICLFLEKKYINEFLSKVNIYGKYSNDSEEARIIRRSMSIMSIILPKERIKSDKKSMSVALDMLNELKRCPRELFDTLSYGDQDRFRIISSDYNEVLQMRHNDRFAHMSLQYIDSNRLFDSIRFHVNMGKLRYLFSSDKLCIDGQVRVRVLERPLNGFGRIEEMEETRRSENGTFVNTDIEIRDFDNVKRDDANADNYPYVVDTYTHYILENNKIEMDFVGRNEFPHIEPKGNKWNVLNPFPTCRMSVLELPAMMFHMHLLGPKATEARIKSVYYNYQKLFKAMSQGALTAENIDSFNIARCDMPQKVLDFIAGKSKSKNYIEHVKKTIAELITDTNKRIKRLEEDKKRVNSDDNKIGKRGFRQIKSGVLAQFLAEDIVKFQPTLSDGTDRLTGLNYRVMQSVIATYNVDDENGANGKLYGMFKKAGLVEGKKDMNHPFLGSALSRRPHNTVEFYKDYLYARKQYLESLAKEVDEGKIKKVSFVNWDKNKWAVRDSDYYEMMGEIYLEDVVMELPRQMFDEEIKRVLKTLPQMKDINYDDSNVTYLIGEYFKRVFNDEPQEFYSWKRNYRYMDMLLCKTNEKNSLCENYINTAERENLWENREKRTEEYKKWAEEKKQKDRNLRKLKDTDYENIIAKRLSVTRNDFQKNEKVIRRFKVQDILMFLLVKDTFKNIVDLKANDFKLCDIMPDTDKGILSEVIPMDFAFEKGGKKYIIHSDELKLKNYGDFFALANDKRIVTLLNILSTNKVNKEELENEFANYDTCRPNVVKMVLDFERYAYDRYPSLKQRVKPGEHFDFSALLQELISLGDLNNEDTKILSQIRNAFNHNAYPNSRGIVEIRVLPEVAKNLIRLFGNYARLN